LLTSTGTVTFILSHETAALTGQARPLHSSAVHELRFFETIERQGRRVLVLAFLSIPLANSIYSLIENLRWRFPKVDLLEAFGIEFNPDSLMALPSDATDSNLQQFALKELQFLFDHYSKDRMVEEGHRHSPITKIATVCIANTSNFCRCLLTETLKSAKNQTWKKFSRRFSIPQMKIVRYFHFPISERL
jgi:hypothetical protein